MNKEQQQIIDEAYKVFYENALSIKKGYEDGDMLGSQPHIDEMFSNPDELIILTKEEFINKCKTDVSFSVEWGLKIEEKELSTEERWRIRFDYYPKDKQFPWDRMALPSHSFLDNFNIPTKLITITYKDKTIESYE
jgi:hypothetical protein